MRLYEILSEDIDRLTYLVNYSLVNYINQNRYTVNFDELSQLVADDMELVYNAHDAQFQNRLKTALAANPKVDRINNGMVMLTKIQDTDQEQDSKDKNQDKEEKKSKITDKATKQAEKSLKGGKKGLDLDLDLDK